MTEPMTAEFLPHFTGLSNDRIELPWCAACERHHWYPLPCCPYCRHAIITWKVATGPVRLYSWTVVCHAFDPTLSTPLPYVVALATFDDAPGVRLVTNLVDIDPDDIHFDMVLAPVFVHPPGARPQVKFRPADRTGS